jgi:hypothetical protein
MTNEAYKIEKMAEFNAAIQKIQNSLRDWRDEDPCDNDDHWYAIIDSLSDLTKIQPE